MRLAGSISQISGSRGICRVAFFGVGFLFIGCAILYLKYVRSPGGHPAPTQDRAQIAARSEDQHLMLESVSQEIRKNLADALASAERIQDGITRRAAMAAAFETWSRTDIEGALSWLEKRPDADPEFNPTECLVEALLKIDPIVALDRLDRSENFEIRDSLKNSFMLRLAEINPHPVVLELLIVRRENWTIRAAVAETIIDQWFRQSPEEAAKLIALLPPGVEQDQAKLSATDAWSGLSPNKTATWVESFPDGPIKDDALQRVTKAWLAQDLSAPMKWIQGMQAGRSRDVAIATLCVQLGEIYPSELSGWAKQINDEALRKQALATIKTTN